MTLRTPLVALRWVAVVLAVLVWIVVVPLIELIALAGRSLRRLARNLVHRDDRGLAVASSAVFEPAAEEIEPSEVRQRRAG